MGTVIEMVTPSGGGRVPSSARSLRRRTILWRTARWAGRLLLGAAVVLLCELALAATAWWQLAALFATAVAVGTTGSLALAEVGSRQRDAEQDLAVRRRQEADDRVLQPLRAQLPTHPDRLQVGCAHDRRDLVERDVALVKTYMATRPYDLELELSEADRPWPVLVEAGGRATYGTVLQYRLRVAS